MYQLACGQCGMSDSEFWQCTLRDVNNRIKGFFELEQYRQQREWERSRWLATVLLSPSLQKGKTLKPKDLIEFEWEKPKAKPKKQLSEQEEKERKEFLAKLDKLHFEEKKKKLNG